MRKKIRHIENAVSIEELASVLELDAEKLYEAHSNINYKRFSLPKKSGGLREIQVPNENLKDVQRALNRGLSQLYAKAGHPFVFGVKDSSIKDNAKVHVGKSFVLNMDIKNFFDSIEEETIIKMFSIKPFNYDLGLTSFMSALVSYEGHLPTGAPTSSIMANLICYHLDKGLMKLAEQQGLEYSRYVDDLSFSSHKPISLTFIAGVRFILRGYGFTENESKRRISSHHSRQLVTGLVVNEKVNVDRRLIRKVRAMIHTWDVKGIDKFAKETYGSEADLDLAIAKLRGLISFIRLVRGKKDSVYLKLFNRFDILEKAFVASK
jgi:RNA-directed DNA polymerase